MSWAPGWPAGTVRSVVLTGVSRGLGAALFDEFVAAGDRVVALGRRFTEEQRALASAQPHRIRLRETDLADPASLPSATELTELLAAGDPAAAVVLVHNAAVFEPFGPVGTLDPAGVISAVNVNMIAPILLTNMVLSGHGIPSGGPDVRISGRPLKVLFISSSAAHKVAGGRSVYSSTKRAAETFFASLSAEREFDPQVQVAIVDPGIMDTDMQSIVRRHAREDAYFPGRERFIERYERGELPAPAEVARKIIEEHLR
jgi:NAD(P)-dependent dehydrogenase (short-subunit alcohol dehydrogenase family)